MMGDLRHPPPRRRVPRQYVLDSPGGQQFLFGVASSSGSLWGRCLGQRCFLEMRLQRSMAGPCVNSEDTHGHIHSRRVSQLERSICGDNGAMTTRMRLCLPPAAGLDNLTHRVWRRVQHTILTNPKHQRTKWFPKTLIVSHNKSKVIYEKIV